MCVVSMTGDFWRKRWDDPRYYPKRPMFPTPMPWEVVPPTTPTMPTPDYDWNDIIKPVVPISKEEFDQLKRDVELMKELLKESKAYDERNNEPHCEIEDKMEFLRQVAKLVGISLDDVIGGKEKE